MNKPLSRLTKKKREITQISKIRNERVDITTHMDIKRVVKEYCEQLCAHKIDNLDEKDQFLGRHSLLKLTQEIHNLSRPISIKEIEPIINKLLKQKASGQMGSLVSSTKHLGKTLYQFSVISSRR